MLCYPAKTGKTLCLQSCNTVLLRLCYYSLLSKRRLAEIVKLFTEDLLWWEVTGVLFCCKLSVPSFISLIFMQLLCLISTDWQTIFHGFPAKYVDLCYWRNLSVINQAHSVDLEGNG